MASRVISLIADNPKTSFFFAFGAGEFNINFSIQALIGYAMIDVLNFKMI